MPWGDGDFVNADHPWVGSAGPAQLFTQVLLVQGLDGLPIEEQVLGYLLDRGLAAASAHGEIEPLGVQWVRGEPIQLFALHAAAPGARNPAGLEGEVDPFVTTGQIADTA